MVAKVTGDFVVANVTGDFVVTSDAPFYICHFFIELFLKKFNTYKRVFD